MVGQYTECQLWRSVHKEWTGSAAPNQSSRSCEAEVDAHEHHQSVCDAEDEEGLQDERYSNHKHSERLCGNRISLCNENDNHCQGEADDRHWLPLGHESVLEKTETFVADDKLANGDGKNQRDYNVDHG